MKANKWLNILQKLKSKRFMFVFLLLCIYVVAKVIVFYTPDPDDDQIPDQVRDVLLHIIQTDCPDTESGSAAEEEPTYQVTTNVLFGERD